MPRWIALLGAFLLAPACRGETSDGVPSADDVSTGEDGGSRGKGPLTDATVTGVDGDDAAPLLAPLDPLYPGGLSLGYYHACIIQPSLEVTCFPHSANNCGGLLDRNCAPPGLKGVAVAAGHVHNCVLRPPGQKPRLRCWGPAWLPRAVAIAHDATLDPVQVVVGDAHSCVLNRDHSVACVGEAMAKSNPPAGLKAKFLAACGVFTCAIGQDDSVICWGAHPPPVPSGLKALHIAVANDGNWGISPEDFKMESRHACAVTLDGSVVCWGDDDHGQLRVPAGLKATQVAVGTSHSCALQTDGLVACWGRLKSTSPVRSKWISSGHLGACAIREDNTVFCSAANFGQGETIGHEVLPPDSPAALSGTTPPP